MSAKAHLLIIDDDQNTLASLARAFRLAGYEATAADCATRALALLERQRFDIILSDVVMPGKDGLALLEDLRALGVTAPVVMMSGQATVEMAVRATRLGAVDFIEKPLSTEKLLVTVENALRLSRLEQENRQLRDRLGRHALVWESRTMEQLMTQVQRVASGETRIAILGESGTGKELIARTIHEKSPRHAGPFVTLNCASVPAELIESELFGHEKGAFTGAAGRRVGKFEQADGGTLFLDEIGDMPLAMQAKLLRVLEEGEIERVGGEGPIPVDVRVVVATHRDLDRMVHEGTFRQDLFHRIYVFPLRLPSLRERIDDIPVLIEHFARQIAEQNGWKPRQFAAATIAELKRYTWPGNVRELRNVVERLLLVAPGDGEIGPEVLRTALPALGAGPGVSAAAFGSGALADRVEGFERATIEAELKRQGFHITNTAKALGLERSHLYKKCQQLGIDLDALRRRED
jgi:two-component system nitrogen regulation response regulator NtrX